MNTITFMEFMLSIFIILMAWQMYTFSKQNKEEQSER